MCAAAHHAAASDVVTPLPLDLGWRRNTLGAHWLEPLDTLIVAKSCAGFDRAAVEDVRGLFSMIARGGLAGLKYLVFDFAHPDDGATADAGEGFEELIAATAELILEAPVITVAWARTTMAGADLDFALYCSMIVAQTDARFSFEGEPDALSGLYSALSRRIGFVKAERLIEQGQTLNAEEMRDLCLVKEVVEPQTGFCAFEQYIRRSARRYNASCAVFRAQRIAMSQFDRQQMNRRL